MYEHFAEIVKPNSTDAELLASINPDRLPELCRYHRDMLEDPLLGPLETEMIFVEDALHMVDVEVVVGFG